jgi:hypothetical protein
MEPTTTVQQFFKSLTNLNSYAFYIPDEYPSKLNLDKIIEILEQAKATTWHEAMVSAKH